MDHMEDLEDFLQNNQDEMEDNDHRYKNQVNFQSRLDDSQNINKKQGRQNEFESDQNGEEKEWPHQQREFDFEIIRQGSGMTMLMRTDLLHFFRQSFSQQEYKNPADYIKHHMDSKYDPYWFIFMWEDKQNHTAQYSYYNEEDKVLEFRAHGWMVLAFAFHLPQQQPQFNRTIQQPKLPSYDGSLNLKPVNTGYWQMQFNQEPQIPDHGYRPYPQHYINPPSYFTRHRGNY